jgi:hypothetical protein
VFKPGNDPRRGRGPKKGAPNAGRPLDEWKAYLRSLVDSAASRDAIVAILTDPSHPAYARVLAWADERGWGKESQAVDATHRGDQDAPIHIKVTRHVIRPSGNP